MLSWQILASVLILSGSPFKSVNMNVLELSRQTPRIRTEMAAKTCALLMASIKFNDSTITVVCLCVDEIKATVKFSK